MSEDYDVWLDGFTTVMIDVGGIKTAVHSAASADEHLPMVLFVHGLSGDFHGLVPVAYELRTVCRAVFVDLPGHGKTAIPSHKDALAQVGYWARNLRGSLQEHGFDSTIAVGHSFGSYVVQEAKYEAAGLINPPFAPSSLSRRGVVLLGRAPWPVGKMYGSYPAMVSRGHWLMHTRTPETDDIIAWSSNLTRVNKRQFQFQSRFAAALSANTLMNISMLAAVPKLLLIVSQYDKIVDNSNIPVAELPNATVVTLPTNHASVFEMPKRIADEIRHLL